MNNSIRVDFIFKKELIWTLSTIFFLKMYVCILVCMSLYECVCRPEVDFRYLLQLFFTVFIIVLNLYLMYLFMQLQGKLIRHSTCMEVKG